MRLFDTTQRWASWSTANTATLMVLHPILSGWIGFGLFFFNAYNATALGPYVSNIFHFYATYTLASVGMNLNVPRKPKALKLVVLLSLIWAVTLTWEFLELLVFGLPNVYLLDTLIDLTTGMLGALAGTYHAERSIP